MLRDLVDTLLPPTCVGCQTVGDALCNSCRGALRRAPEAPAPPGVDWWVAVFAYEGVAREAIARAKYRDQRTVLSWLAAQLAPLCTRSDLDVVAWVPASHERKRDHGVDHAEVLARHVARRCDLPLRRLLVRERDRPQTGRGILERRSGPNLRAREVAHVMSRRVLVVDDVATTGATAAAVARVLRNAGADSVAFATVARTPRRR